MRNTLKWATLLVALCLAITPFVGAQTRTKTFTATGSDSSLRLIGTGIYNHRLIWQGAGTRTECQIKVEKSVNNSTWADLITDQTCTGDGSIVVIGWANYVRITVTAISGANNTLYAVYVGLPAEALNGYGGTLASGVTSAMTGTTSTSVIGGTANHYLYITQCAFSNTHASVTTMMTLQDGSAGTSLGSYVVSFGSGNNVIFPIPLKVTTAGNGLFVVNVTTGSNTFASCSGYKTGASY